MRSYRRRFVEQALSELHDQRDGRGGHHRHSDICSWDCPCRYRLDASLFSATHLPIRELGPDQGGRDFIARSQQVSIFRVVGAILLRNWYSVTDANALCRTGDMHIFSTAQICLLMGLGEDHDPRGTALLDVGAGDGGITSQLSPLFERVVTTEVSERMISRLQELGFQAVLTANPKDVVPETGLDRFDCVACLNVLDRCDRPLDLLQSMRDLVRHGTGVLILAVVLPFRPGIETGTDWRRPDQSLPDRCYESRFEIAANAFAVEVLEPLGLRVEAVTRLPYMSFSVSMTQNYALLDDSVFICRWCPLPT